MALQSTTPIATITLQQATSTVTFSGIPDTYRDLILVANGGATTGANDIYFQFNGDGGSNYSNVQMSANGSVATSRTDGTTFIRTNFYAAWHQELTGNMIATIFDYSATNKHKTVVSRTNKASGGSFQGVDAAAGRWASTAQINSITMLTNASYLAGSTFSLYGRVA
jgi:hypothetical protein